MVDIKIGKSQYFQSLLFQKGSPFPIVFDSLLLIVLPSIQFDLVIQAEKDTRYWLIPTDVYKSIMEQSAPLANYTNEIMASRFSEVMWLIEQIMWQSLDKRVAAFLLEESAIEGTTLLKITHETIANHLGTHREVITRMLKYFQNEGMIRLTRGTLEILSEDKLQELQNV